MKLSFSIFALLGGIVAANAGIANGSFQTGAGQTADNWTLAGSVSLALTDADYAAGAGAVGSSPFGGRFLSFNAADNAADNSATQDFATVAGQQYTLTFDSANYGANTLQQLNVTLSDSGFGTLASSVVSDSTGGTDLSAIWSASLLTFTAYSTLTTLTFTDAGSSTYSTDLLVDNVAVQAVPEPMSMVALGFGALALLRRRRA